MHDPAPRFYAYLNDVVDFLSLRAADGSVAAAAAAAAGDGMMALLQSGEKKKKKRLWNFDVTASHFSTR